jgi:hypothetical protein
MHAEGCGDIPYVCVFVFVQKKKGKHLTTRIQVWQEPISFATKYSISYVFTYAVNNEKTGDFFSFLTNVSRTL